MRRALALAATAVVAGALVSGCGGGHGHKATTETTVDNCKDVANSTDSAACDQQILEEEQANNN